ncbi:MAG TPA: DUF1080 domain-containing protein [Phycisphaerae bacterium]|nr:DUF1080 domain-containing protein [Phycisphaerae bacterium]
MRSFLTVFIVLAGMSWIGCDSREQGGPASAQAPEAGAPQADKPQGVELFNGRDLSGWTFVLDQPGVGMDDVWSVKDGVLSCKGKPAGYLRTLKDYESYVLDVEWRWPDPEHPGNNGVLVHTSTPGVLGVWPKSIEVQLANGAAGDFWIIGTELTVTDIEKRRKGRRHLRLVDDVEKPLGEWNHIEITCRGNEVLVKVNGTLVNHATDCNVTSGAICLQSEGAPIEYRNIRLRPLDN